MLDLFKKTLKTALEYTCTLHLNMYQNRVKYAYLVLQQFKIRYSTLLFTPKRIHIFENLFEPLEPIWLSFSYKSDIIQHR